MPRSPFPPGLDESPVLVELHDPRVVGWLAPVAVCNEDVSVRGDGHLGRLIEGVGPRPDDACAAQGHEECASAAELEDLLTTSFLHAVVSHPEISGWIDGDLVRADQQSRAETLEKRAGLVEFEDGIERRAEARRAACAGCAASIERPDVAVRPDR